MTAPRPRWIDGGITTPAGFRAGAAACGLKASGDPDVALLGAARPCAAAGVFTRNQIVAAPVALDRRTLAGGAASIRGVVANAGVANAATGAAGDRDAVAMQALAAGALGCTAGQVLVLSTGVIGRRLPMARLERGIAAAAADLSAGGGAAFARAIMTTDTHPKTAAVAVELPGGRAIVGGAAKGAGMIHPDMATMLAVVTTDAAAAPGALDRILRAAAARTFNRITVDGDTSTNDTVLLLASGAAGVPADTPPAEAALAAAVEAVCRALALAIVRDAEGATKLVALTVTGAHDDGAALDAARAIATSPLVKTAFAGGDPNWGRIVAAAGRSGARLDPARLRLAIGPLHLDLPGGDPAGRSARAARGGPDDRPLTLLLVDGAPLDDAEASAAAIMRADAFAIHLDLGTGGEGAETVWTCDLTRDYVTINADYRT